MRRRNLKALDLGRDRDTKADRLFKVFDLGADGGSTRHGTSGKCRERSAEEPRGNVTFGSGEHARASLTVTVEAAAGSSAGLHEPPETPMQEEEREEDQDEGEEALGFIMDATADQTVADLVRPARKPSMPALTKEEVQEAEAAWRVEGSARAGFKVFRRKDHTDEDNSPPTLKKRSRSSKRRKRSHRREEMAFPDL
ncbi:unnamed protein product [Symbiodinium sp. CCMP2456]|nr:unnamed protein product [Symbiodinium sp. CCMP2456]